MAYHIDKENGDLVIDGFDAGMADAPEKGIAFMRNINLVSAPGEATLNYATSAINVPTTQVSGTSCSFTGSTDVVSWTTGGVTLYNGEAITFGSSTGGVTAGNIYWVGNVTNGATGTFKVYTNINRDNVVNLTDASNTFTVISFGTPTYKALDTIGTATSPNNIFILDSNGRAWWINLSGNLVYIGNSTLTSTHGNGICVLGAFLYVFRDQAIDYLPVDAITNSSDTAGQWVYAWKTADLTSNSASNAHSHYAIVAQDNGMYFCNDQFVGSVLATSGNNVDPSSSSTFTYNAQALRIPQIDLTTCLAELGTTLLVGGIQNKIYPWDRVSTSFAYPIIVSEAYTTRMVTTNSNTYVFAGNRGRIYVTNGSNLSLFKKVPDSFVNIFSATNGADPYFQWLDAVFWKNQIYFSFRVYKNDGTSVNSAGGLWGLDMSLNVYGNYQPYALRLTNTLASGATAYPYVIAQNIRSTMPAGAGLYLPYFNTSDSSTGVEITTTTPYTSFTTGIGGEIYTELIPVGTLLKSRTFTQVEWKTSQPLVSGDGVRVSMRQSYGDSFTVQGTTTTAGKLSDVYTTNLQGVDSTASGSAQGQWVELYVETQGASSGSSLTRLTELRLR